MVLAHSESAGDVGKLEVAFHLEEVVVADDCTEIAVRHPYARLDMETSGTGGAWEYEAAFHNVPAWMLVKFLIGIDGASDAAGEDFHLRARASRGINPLSRENVVGCGFVVPDGNVFELRVHELRHVLPGDGEDDLGEGVLERQGDFARILAVQAFKPCPAQVLQVPACSLERENRLICDATYGAP